MEDKCNCWNEHAGSKCGSVGKKSWAEWAQIGGSSKGITDHQCRAQHKEPPKPTKGLGKRITPITQDVWEKSGLLFMKT